MKDVVALTATGLVRATPNETGGWDVERSTAFAGVTCLSAGVIDDGQVYAGTDRGSILVSTDRGSTWRETGSLGREVKSIAVAPSAPGTLYAGTKPPLLFVSEDFGATWVELVEFRKIPWRWLWRSPAELPFSAYVQAIAVPPNNPEVILAGIEAGAVVRSEDGGLSWEGHRQGAVRDCHNLVFHPRFGEWAYEAGGSGNGAAFSKNAGSTWTQPRRGLDKHYCWAVATDPEDPETWYVSASPGAMKAHSAGNAQACIYRTRRNGPWECLSGGLDQPLESMPYSLVIDPSNPAEVYAGMSNGEVWHSDDRGDAWEKLQLNLGSIERSMIII